MNTFTGVWRIVWGDVKRSFFIFWAILIASSLVIIGVSQTVSSGSIYLVTNMPMLVYASVLGSQLFHNTFSYALSLGCSRGNFYKGLVGSLTFIILLLTVTHLIVWKAFDLIPSEAKVFNMWSFLTKEDHLLTFVWYDFIVSFMMLAIFLLLSVVRYRYGTNVLYVLAGLMFVAIFTGVVTEVIIERAVWFLNQPILIQSLWCIGTIFMMTILVWPLVLKSKYRAKNQIQPQ
ncbi:hypothetical protein [Halobacillus amylolyticus]|uniref:DUF4052 domain-containing protein n=1 Tax=Halobacillus amylolyticus TaxID=2932259 RepID=A0ABY4HBC4_9BACI|nr:hypothetical protein [Halobacillus amylolyticus]UOR11851.1 hypothetical protein MUO15_20200 [Halobacillus amylolyticus]